MPQLEGKVAIVTGAGSGIGRAIALGFAREGASVAVADVDGAAAERVAAEIGERAIVVRCDVSVTADAEAMVAATIDRFGRVDILVNNAGRFRGSDPISISAPGASASRTTDDTWDAVFAVNVRGTFVCSRAVLSHMIPQRSGVIINTASGLGLRPAIGAAAYGASKAAIIHFTQTMAAEVARYGVRVNAFTPGVTDTPFWRAARTDAEVEEAYREGRVGQPGDMVPLLVFLASDAGRDISGVTIAREVFVRHHHKERQ